MAILNYGMAYFAFHFSVAVPRGSRRAVQSLEGRVNCALEPRATRAN